MARPKRLLPEKLQATCDAFNERHPVGSMIRVWPAEIGGRTDDVMIAKPGAYVMGGHSAVVQVGGGTRADGSPASYGCVALKHVRGSA